jgi:hypothetical protein
MLKTTQLLAMLWIRGSSGSTGVALPVRRSTFNVIVTGELTPAPSQVPTPLKVTVSGTVVDPVGW